MRSNSVGRPLAPSRTDSEAEIESMIDLGTPHLPEDSPLPRRISLRPPSPVRATPRIPGVAPTRTTASSGPSHEPAGSASSLYVPGGFVNPRDLLRDPTTVLLDSMPDARPTSGSGRKGNDKVPGSFGFEGIDVAGEDLGSDEELEQALRGFLQHDASNPSNAHGAPSGNPAPFGLNEQAPGPDSGFGGVPVQGDHAPQTQAWSPLWQTMADDSEHAGYPPVPGAQWDAALSDPMWGMAAMAAAGAGPQGYGNPQGHDNPQAPFGLNESGPGLHSGFGGVPVQGGYVLQTQAWSPLEQTMADSEHAGYLPVPDAQWDAALSDPARKRKADKEPPDGPPAHRVARGAGEAQSSRAGGISPMSAQSVEGSGAPTVQLSEAQKRKIQKNGGQAAIAAVQTHAHALMVSLQAGGLGLSVADIVKIAAHHGGAGTLETLTKNDGALVTVLMAEPLKLTPEAIVNIANHNGATKTFETLTKDDCALVKVLMAEPLRLKPEAIVNIANNAGATKTFETLTKNDCALVKVLMAEPLKLKPEAIVNIARFAGASDTLRAVATLQWRDSMDEVKLLRTVCRNSGSKALRKALAS